MPAVTISLVNYYHTRQQFTSNTYMTLNQITASMAGNVDDWVNSRLKKLEKDATAPELQSGDKEKIRAFVKMVADQTSDADMVFFIGPDGMSIPSSGPEVNVTDRDYYQQAIKGKENISNLIVKKDNGHKVIAMAVPVKGPNGIIGVFGAFFNSQTLLQQVKNNKYGQTGYAFMIDGTGVVMAHQDEQKVLNENLTQTESTSLNAVAKKMLQGQAGEDEFDRNGVRNLVAYAPVKGTGWTVALTAPHAEVYAGVSAMGRFNLILIILAALLIAVIALFISRQIAKPIIALARQADVLATGDLRVEINTGYYGELGILGRSLKTMVDNLRAIVQKVQESAGQIASAAQEFSASTEEASKSVEQAATAVQDMAKGANEQATQAQNMAERISSISSIITMTANKIESAARFSEEAREHTEDGLQIVKRQNQKMQENLAAAMNVSKAINELARQAQEVGRILETISSIADQTNLLALNAAIEAARAGEHGRGFAVVADEVRKLAEGSAQATEEIAQIVEKIQMGARGAVAEMDKARQIVDEQKEAVSNTNVLFQSIADKIKTVAESLEEIAAGAEKLKADAQSITENIHEVSAVAEENAAGAEEISASSEEQSAAVEEIAASANSLASLGQELSQAVSQFKL
ncbi:methyl-accepting chemotaxis protein [Neomoorella thermoacetica]|uniref:methyl-accepting chemotaxis protein n=1 Tax=Neomoorella thermoacetica TaxID=1525 RepID=UPI001E30DC5F|nr:methyl-accepting chemotaxis protein [Moorella thermoacetica]